MLEPISKKLIDTEASHKDSALDYNPIYKVNYLVDENIDTIYIFRRWLSAMQKRKSFSKGCKKPAK